MAEQINKLSAEEVDTLFSNYEVKLSGQMLGKSIIRIYSMGACAALGMSNQDALSKDLESELHSPEVYVQTVLQIRFITRTSKCQTNYEQALLG